MRRLVLGLSVALMACACGGAGPTLRLSDGRTATAHGAADASGVTATVMEMNEYYFSPTVLHGAPGESLTITLSNQGNAQHNFRIPTQHIDVSPDPSSPATVTVVFPQTGALTFECKYHLIENMRGQLVADQPRQAPARSPA